MMVSLCGGHDCVPVHSKNFTNHSVLLNPISIGVLDTGYFIFPSAGVEPSTEIACIFVSQ